MNPEKKKKATVAELALGGGLFALFLPVILFALVWAIIGVAIGAAYTFIIHDSIPLWPMLLVYGGLLIAMLFLTYKFSARFALLVRRWIGLIRERRRIRLETMPLADAAVTAHDPLLDDDTAQQIKRVH